MVPRLERDVANIEEGYAQEMYDYQLDPAFTEDKLIDLEEDRDETS